MVTERPKEISLSSAPVPAGASEEWLRSLIDEEHRKLTAGMNLIDAAHGEFIIKAAVNALRRLSPSADLLKAAKEALQTLRKVGHRKIGPIAAIAKTKADILDLAIRSAGGQE